MKKFNQTGTCRRAEGTRKMADRKSISYLACIDAEPCLCHRSCRKPEREALGSEISLNREDFSFKPCDQLTIRGPGSWSSFKDRLGELK